MLCSVSLGEMWRPENSLSFLGVPGIFIITNILLRTPEGLVIEVSIVYIGVGFALMVLGLRGLLFSRKPYRMKGENTGLKRESYEYTA